MTKPTRNNVVSNDPPFRFVLIRAFSHATGYTPKAVYRKIERGDWIEGREYRRAPDGRILIDCVGVQQWIVG